MTIKEKLKGRNLTNIINNKSNNKLMKKFPTTAQKKNKKLAEFILQYKNHILILIVLQLFIYLSDLHITILSAINPNLIQKQSVKNSDWDYFNPSAGAWAEGHCVDNDRPSPVNLVLNENQQEKTCIEHSKVQFVRNNEEQIKPFTDNERAVQMDGYFSDLFITQDNGVKLQYKSLQFHFHTPAEHTINGKIYDLEMHIVHQLDSTDVENPEQYDQFAVVGFFFELSDEENPLFDIHELNPQNTCTGSACQTFKKTKLNFGKFDQFSLENFLNYKGSLTTPPCSPVVNWFLNPTPLPINEEQLSKFKSNPNLRKARGVGNAREVQGDVVPTFFDKQC